MSHLNIVFAGTPEFALPCLDALMRSQHVLKAVYTQPDRIAGRGQKLQASAVKQWALAQNVPVYQPLNFKEVGSIQTLAELQPDLLLVIAYGLILPEAVLAIPKFGAINVHASLLPRWRGASPIQQAVRHGDYRSGVSIMQMERGLDTGPVLTAASYQLAPRETAGSLHDKLAMLAVEPLLLSLEALMHGQANLKPQASEGVTYASKILKADALIDWQQSAEDIDRHIRAFNPWPIATTRLGEQVIRIHEARVLNQDTKDNPGSIMAMDSAGIQVATKKQVLLIERLQFPGGKVLRVADYLNASRPELAVNLVLR